MFSNQDLSAKPPNFPLSVLYADQSMGLKMKINGNLKNK
jgi:hypothetical protein